MRKVKKARKLMRKAFLKDEDLWNSYVSNVAMLLYDKYGITDFIERNRAARAILRLIFGIKGAPK